MDSSWSPLTSPRLASPRLASSHTRAGVKLKKGMQLAESEGSEIHTLDRPVPLWPQRRKCIPVRGGNGCWAGLMVPHAASEERTNVFSDREEFKGRSLSRNVTQGKEGREGGKGGPFCGRREGWRRKVSGWGRSASLSQQSVSRRVVLTFIGLTDFFFLRTDHKERTDNIRQEVVVMQRVSCAVWWCQQL
ncbi:hypothetical protein E2C01_003909 [Portunus trituberculatus]|uniref:Uncharacterized protein n=1 Tax=Portunus trituberculatus TaxID=210409 RepID=A0A5B7CNH3_PORTR|nr:hypothetical protein [Portunus trituberculatus]